MMSQTVLRPLIVDEKRFSIDEKVTTENASSYSHSSGTTCTLTPTLSPIENFLSDQRTVPLTNTPPSSEPSVSVEGNSFFDLRPPAPSENPETRVEETVRQLFSKDHLHFIISDHHHLSRLTSFLHRYRPHLVSVLIRYCEMRKTMKAIEYANSIARNIRWPSHNDQLKFSRFEVAQIDLRFEDFAINEVNTLISEALQAWVTSQLVNIVSDLVSREITGQSLPVLKDLIGSLGEVFCITDPHQKDNPIVFCSEEFNRTTQYGTNFAINRNCRILQGPHTDKKTTARLSKSIAAGQESTELLLNYRRDGSPFINLLMVSPLFDDQGNIRYFLGAQIDVTGLVLDGLGLDSFRGMLHKQQNQNKHPQHQSQANPPITSFSRPTLNTDLTNTVGNTNYHTNNNDPLVKLTELLSMLSTDESEIVSRNIISISPPNFNDTDSVISDACSIRSMLPTHKAPRPQRRIIDSNDNYSGLPRRDVVSSDIEMIQRPLARCYRNFLLVRPYPSLQIIFVSPSLRLPGLIRTPLFTKIGGSANVLSSLEDALRDGVPVTARVLWLAKHSNAPNAKARRRWIRCTPLHGANESVGVWMVILVPVDVDDYRLQSMHDSGYQSMNSPICVPHPTGAGTPSPIPQQYTSEENGELASIQSLVGGRQNTNYALIGARSRNYRVTILDSDREDSCLADNYSASISYKATNTFVSPHNSDESSKFSPCLSNLLSTPTIEEEM